MLEPVLRVVEPVSRVVEPVETTEKFEHLFAQVLDSFEQVL